MLLLSWNVPGSGSSFPFPEHKLDMFTLKEHLGNLLVCFTFWDWTFWLLSQDTVRFILYKSVMYCKLKWKHLYFLQQHKDKAKLFWVPCTAILSFRSSNQLVSSSDPCSSCSGVRLSCQLMLLIHQKTLQRFGKWSMLTCKDKCFSHSLVSDWHFTKTKFCRVTIDYS